ncbi:hypothetical protein BJ508DRAFT_329583 [Ascobolus immersus RN42]|uniref:Uncharacterized protein n=1 Tax=Ascobolus immersus RN42 TaxID=1160509 RepID=A0A3N4I1H1_ASCIM|nr:hypothetical protein BJ508DRAFT_329583 [Ascobolus immersus RN42]
MDSTTFHPRPISLLQPPPWLRCCHTPSTHHTEETSRSSSIPGPNSSGSSSDAASTASSSRSSHNSSPASAARKPPSSLKRCHSTPAFLPRADESSPAAVVRRLELEMLTSTGGVWVGYIWNLHAGQMGGWLRWRIDFLHAKLDVYPMNVWEDAEFYGSSQREPQRSAGLEEVEMEMDNAGRIPLSTEELEGLARVRKGSMESCVVERSGSDGEESGKCSGGELGREESPVGADISTVEYDWGRRGVAEDGQADAPGECTEGFQKEEGADGDPDFIDSELATGEESPVAVDISTVEYDFGVSPSVNNGEGMISESVNDMDNKEPDEVVSSTDSGDWQKPSSAGENSPVAVDISTVDFPFNRRKSAQATIARIASMESCTFTKAQRRKDSKSFDGGNTSKTVREYAHPQHSVPLLASTTANPPHQVQTEQQDRPYDAEAETHAAESDDISIANKAATYPSSNDDEEGQQEPSTAGQTQVYPIFQPGDILPLDSISQMSWPESEEGDHETETVDDDRGELPEYVGDWERSVDDGLVEDGSGTSAERRWSKTRSMEEELGEQEKVDDDTPASINTRPSSTSNEDTDRAIPYESPNYGHGADEKWRLVERIDELETALEALKAQLLADRARGAYTKEVQERVWAEYEMEKDLKAAKEELEELLRLEGIKQKLYDGNSDTSLRFNTTNAGKTPYPSAETPRTQKTQLEDNPTPTPHPWNRPRNPRPKATRRPPRLATQEEYQDHRMEMIRNERYPEEVEALQFDDARDDPEVDCDGSEFYIPVLEQFAGERSERGGYLSRRPSVRGDRGGSATSRSSVGGGRGRNLTPCPLASGSLGASLESEVGSTDYGSEEEPPDDELEEEPRQVHWQTGLGGEKRQVEENVEEMSELSAAPGKQSADPPPSAQPHQAQHEQLHIHSRPPPHHYEPQPVDDYLDPEILRARRERAERPRQIYTCPSTSRHSLCSTLLPRYSAQQMYGNNGGDEFSGLSVGGGSRSRRFGFLRRGGKWVGGKVRRVWRRVRI